MAGSTPNWTTGYIPPNTEWNALWSGKLDTTGAGSAVTATGGTTPRTLADWFQGLDKTGAQWSLSDGATSGNAVYTAIFPGVTFSDQFSSAMLYPTGATTGQGTAVAAYFRNQAAVVAGDHNAVGLFTAGTAEVNNAASWGINTLLQDAATRTVGTGTGRYLVNELDFNVMCPGTQVIGLSVGGNSLAQPTIANGYIVNPLGTNIRWGGGLLVQDNAVDSAVSIGLYHATSGNNVPSAPIQLVTTDGSGSKQVIVISATTGNTFSLNGTAGANLAVPGTGTFGGLHTTSGLTLSAPVTVTASTYTALATDTMLVLNPSAGQTLTLGTATAGRVLWLKLISAFAVISASSNVVPQAGGSAGTAILAATAGKFALLVGDGTNWQVMTSN